ncbi:MAG: PKD domain-containing protein [candidate division Zixibacteria bacterium]|nr:PKD domain-containing protein [candidate division Zixibacteria bacterium]
MRKFAIAALIIGLAFLAVDIHAQITYFAPPVTHSVGDNPYSVCVGDFDNDSTVDIAVANCYSHSIAVLFNNGWGVFSDTSEFATGMYPFSVVAEDLDGDGDLDLAYTGYADTGYVYTMINTGGAFAASVSYAVGEYPYDIVLADFDGINGPDIAVANETTKNVSVLLNNGDGTFADAVYYDVMANAYGITAGLFNDDADIDLAVRCTQRISLLYGNGDGTFATAESLMVHGNPGGDIVAAYINEDAYQDLAATSGILDSKAYVMLNNGDGTFTAAANYAVKEYPVGIVAVDYNLDNRIDLVSTSFSTDYFTVLKNNGAGVFAPAVNQNISFGSYGIASADFDGDDDGDLIVTHANMNLVSILRNLKYDCVDSDGDGYGDPGFPNTKCPSVDNCPDTYNPDQDESDTDGIGDACDNCPDVNNIHQEDTDLDGIGDSCDTCTDTDNDGYGNPGFPTNTCAEDNCPNTYNPEQGDGDGDGIGDDCDACTDTDGDGYGSPGYPYNTCPEDNCPDVYNYDQKDYDEDGIGDDCDECTDTDGDGYGNPGYPANTCPDDNCPNMPNPGQGDGDSDGIGDECDTCTDSDGDGYGDPGYFRNTCPDDNCPDTPNPDQNDEDNDGRGDACDPGEVNFDADNRCGAVPLLVAFTDLSHATDTIIAWHWDFGDGHASGSKNPMHEYTESGTYDVTLIISDGVNSDILTREGFITTQTDLSTDFMGIPTGGSPPVTVFFDPIVDGVATSYYWTFGDGQTSYERNPIHTYEFAGNYDVSLRVQLVLGDCFQDDTEIKPDYIRVSGLNAKYATDTDCGVAPLVVQFTDSSVGAPNVWYWDFGDGTTSYDDSPLHQYDTAGCYDVFLRVSNAFNLHDSLLEYARIIVADSEIADLETGVYDFGARPGHEFILAAAWTNIGVTPAENCTLKVLPPDEMMLYDSAVWIGAITTGTYTHYDVADDTLIIPLSTIAPSHRQGGCLLIAGTLISGITLGDTISCKTWLSTSTPDENMSNNLCCHDMETVGFVPVPDKTASPAGTGIDHEIPPETRLHYAITFENPPLAVDTVQSVIIVDTLDPNLDWGTLAFDEISHEAFCSFSFNPFTGIVYWLFENIDLPPDSGGYVTYSVAASSNILDGTEIANRAWMRLGYDDWQAAPEFGMLSRIIKAPFDYGDPNGDGSINLLDILLLIEYLYGDPPGPPPIPLESGDANQDGDINLLDILFLIELIYG